MEGRGELGPFFLPCMGGGRVARAETYLASLSRSPQLSSPGPLDGGTIVFVLAQAKAKQLRFQSGTRLAGTVFRLGTMGTEAFVPELRHESWQLGANNVQQCAHF